MDQAKAWHYQTTMDSVVQKHASVSIKRFKPGSVLRILVRTTPVGFGGGISAFKQISLKKSHGMHCTHKPHVCFGTWPFPLMRVLCLGIDFMTSSRAKPIDNY